MEFFGRLHPLVLHLPIGFFLFLGIIEIASFWSRYREAASARKLLVPLTTFAVVIASACGWVLSWSGEYAGDALAWHKWLGTALIPAALMMQLLLKRGNLPVYRVSLFAAILLVTATGHHGGSLVRGSDYLFAVFHRTESREQQPAAERHDPTAAREPAVYTAVIQPILKEYCVNCHGPEKAKGKLLLDNPVNILAGGDSGPVLKAGAASESLLIKRLHLPEDEDEHMPPGGKKQPTAQQAALLEWWINVGAPFDLTASQLRMPEKK